jgi:hypothetical protein
MEHQHDQHDAAIDKVLAALKDAAPPEGMEARIAQRLQRHASAPEAAFRWRDLLAGSSLSGAWWRGAFAGAAAAMMAACAVLLFLHHSQETRQQPTQNDDVAVRSAMPAIATPVVQGEGDSARPKGEPCPPASGTMQLRRTTPTPKPALLRVAGTERHPLLAEPLTAQERGLLLLARTADPQQLAILDPEAQAKLKAQDAEEFEKFFAPPAPPKTQQETE